MSDEQPSARTLRWRAVGEAIDRIFDRQLAGFRRMWRRMEARQRRREREEIWPHDLGGES